MSWSVSHEVLDQLPADWQRVAFTDALSRQSFRVGKVKRSDYQKDGSFPIVDQGQGLIAGYWSEAAQVYDGPLPIIVFGDHTRAFKFVDFPFVCGADGTKILVPDRNRFDPEFLYFALLTLRLPSRGYNRHFNILREQVLPQPPLPEQRAIGNVLRIVQRAREQTGQVIGAARELKKSLMRYLFTSGQLRPEEPGGVTKETDLGSVPDRWPLDALEDLADLRAGGTPRRSDPSLWGGDVPFVKIEDITQSEGRLVATSEYITRDGLKQSSAWLVPAGSVLLTMYATIGATAVNEIPVATNQAILALQPRRHVHAQYLRHALEMYRSRIASLNVRSTQRNVSKSILRTFRIPVPPIEEQHFIADSLRACEVKIEVERQREAALEGLLRSLLRDLMSAHIRVPTQTTDLG